VDSCNQWVLLHIVVSGQDKKYLMMDEKHLHNLVSSEHYRSGDLLAHEEDKIFSLEDGKE
jgi:hypothetical protein